MKTAILLIKNMVFNKENLKRTYDIVRLRHVVQSTCQTFIDNAEAQAVKAKGDELTKIKQLGATYNLFLIEMQRCYAYYLL